MAMILLSWLSVDIQPKKGMVMSKKDMIRMLRQWVIVERRKANRSGLNRDAEMLHLGRSSAYKDLLDILEGKVQVLLPR